MSVTVLFAFLVITNVQCERTCQTTINPNQKSKYHSQNLQSFQRSRNVADLMILKNQHSTDRYDQTTTECNPNDIAPTGSDCTAYYECISGHYELQFCPPNTFFNPELKCCHADYVCPSRAYELPTASLLPCEHGEVRADETNCANYYSCVGDGGYFEQRTCPDGKVFNGTSNRCVPAALGNRCQRPDSQSFESRNIAVGLSCTESSDPSGYSADPTDCRRYYQCAQGRWIRMKCPSNLVWNPAATVCDWPQNTLLPCH
ncbi:Chitin binding Peritrophin-A domain family protein [Brugia pahangi]